MGKYEKDDGLRIGKYRLRGKIKKTRKSLTSFHNTMPMPLTPYIKNRHKEMDLRQPRCICKE